MLREIEGRPLVLACLSLLAGMVTRLALPCIVLAVALLLFIRKPVLRLVVVLCCVLGFWIYKPYTSQIYTERSFFRGPVDVKTMPLETKEGLVCEVETQQGRFELRCKSDVCLGDRIQVVGVVEPPSEIREKRFKSRGLRGVLHSDSEKLKVIRHGFVLWRWAAEWRKSFLGWTQATLGNESAVADALCFNVDSELEGDFRENLQRTGTIHIISASGIHVMIFAFALQWLLSFLPLPRWTMLLVLGFVICLYAAAAGLKPPIVRSAIMSLAIISAYLFKKEGDLLSALSMTAIGYLLFAPESIRDIGFQLSYLNVAGLALFINKDKESPVYSVNRILINVKSVFKASCVASIVSAPAVAYHFGACSLVSPIANLVIGMAITVIVVICMFGSMLHGLLTSIAAGFMVLIVRPMIGWVEMSVNFMGSWSFSSIVVPEFSAYWLIPIYGLMLMTWRKHLREA